MPEGQAMCWQCRRLQRGRTDWQARACLICGARFQPKDHAARKQLACSASCGQKLRYRSAGALRTRPCPGCGCDVTSRASFTFCKDCKRVRTLEYWRRKNRKRRAADIISEPYTLAEIAARDGYRCGLCHRKVNMARENPHPRSATIDHVMPLSISRDDTRANVQLAHRSCNTAKGVRAVGEQLALIG